MKKRKETRGAPKGNQNARKNPEERQRKEYVNVFGQRWSVEDGNKILAYLKRTGLTQKRFLEQVVSEYILNQEEV